MPCRKSIRDDIVNTLRTIECSEIHYVEVVLYNFNRQCIICHIVRKTAMDVECARYTLPVKIWTCGTHARMDVRTVLDVKRLNLSD